MDKENYKVWLQRAESNFRLAKTGKVRGVVYEDLCFELQQSCEKVLKALLIYFGEVFPKVHAFSRLLELIQKHIDLPAYVEDVIELTDYAVQTRYPGDYCPVTREEYLRAVIITRKILN